jgi:Holliday junction resolvase RusA-like endonuclease
VTLFTPELVDITVTGRPAMQGSKTIIVRGGQHIPVEANKHLRAWRRDVSAAARQSMGMYEDTTFPLAEPLRVRLDVFIEQADSNRDPYPTTRSAGDVDKHARACLDALTLSGLITDDCLVVALTARKHWSTDARGPGAHIRIEPLGGTP